MDQQYDPRNVLTAMHHKVTGELLHLMDGFYLNLEDGLFERAFQDDDEAQRRSCFELMREMRHRRTNLIQMFAKRMQKATAGWFEDQGGLRSRQDEHTRLAGDMAEKCSSHFAILLRNIAQRSAYATGREADPRDIPISPFRIAHCFVLSCSALQFDDNAIEIVQELFGRFILDRLGTIYGECNQCLEDAGYYTLRELDSVSTA